MIENWWDIPVIVGGIMIGNRLGNLMLPGFRRVLGLTAPKARK